MPCIVPWTLSALRAALILFAHAAAVVFAADAIDTDTVPLEAISSAIAAEHVFRMTHVHDPVDYIINLVKPWTLASGIIRPLVEYLHEFNMVGTPGDIVECGVWKGGAMALALMQLYDEVHVAATPSRDIWLFDTFEGLPAPTDDDCEVTREAFDRVSAKQVRAGAASSTIPPYLTRTL